MKIKRSLRIGSFAVCCVLGVTALAACGTYTDEAQKDNAALPVAPDGTVIEVNGTAALLAGDYRLDFVSDGDGYYVQLVDLAALSGNTETATAQSVIFTAEAPVGLSLMVDKKIMSYSTAEASDNYNTVSAQEYGYLCTAAVTTENGSTIQFKDRYYLHGGMLAMSRTAEVTAVGSGDFGFETIYSFGSADAGKSYTDFDYFIPAILYKDSRDMTNGAQGSNLNVPKMYVKETRTGLPLAMLRDKNSGYSLALAHLEPEITVNGKLYGGSNGTADNKLQYGSIGYSNSDGMAVDFCYPSAEMQGSGWTRIYHEMAVGSSHTYKISILPQRQNSYAQSMTETFKAAFNAEAPEVAQDVQIDSIYNDNMEVYSATYKEFDTDGIVEAGVPFSLDLTAPDTYGDWSMSQGYNFQMGFIGQQTSIGYFLLRTGIETKNAEMERKGRTMLDFWASSKIMSTSVPAVWWDPNNGDLTASGSARDYPSFLRCFVDGMEGMLDACVYAHRAGLTGYEDWEKAVLKVGSWMTENQNEDGSYYRAYETNGTVCTRTTEHTWQGTSKLNTPIAVRFLVRLYEYTGEEKYREAAIKAAEFSYNHLYLDREKYVGGTPDNPNTVDKEAAVYALYCFDAVYEMTGEEKYLQAAQHAAISALSWVYCYDFAVPSGSSEDINTFADGGVSGFSLIATGHSGADNYASVLYYEFYKLYLYTGDTFYRDAAYFLQQNTKLSSDYNGEVGYAFRALCPEATAVADFSLGGGGAKLWLVWCGVVNVQPIVYMRNTFGEADIAKLADADLQTLQEQLEAYGSGGKIE